MMGCYSRILLSCCFLWVPASCFSAVLQPVSTTTVTAPKAPLEVSAQSLLLVDVENVRGKTNFQQTHEAFVARACAHHASSPQNDILMVLVMDHGAQRTIQAGGPLSKNMAMIFAGPGQKADDVLMALSRDAAVNQTALVVVSSDNEVMQSCTQQGRATIVDPLAFLETLKGLENVGTLFPKNENQPQSKKLDPQQLLQKEVAARQELQMIDRLMNPRKKGGKKSNKKMSRKQRTKLASRQLRAKERLTRVLEESVAQGGTTMQSAIQSTGNSSNSDFEAMVQGVEAASRAQIRRGAAETTYERQLLAERLRRRMEDAGALTRVDVDEECNNNGDLLPKLIEHAAAAAVAAASTSAIGRGMRFRNPDVRYNALDGATLGTNLITVKRNHRASSEQPQKPLRMLVMSDTHGYEEQIFKFVPKGKESAYQLPAADILIHCGDFWGGSRSKAQQLDSFLAAQTHIPTKIIVRGNHDPRTPGSVLFPKSRAMYVTKTSTLELDGIIVALRPHSRNYNEALLPPKCDVLISHEPPYGVLDYTYHDQRAGSNALRYCVEASVDKPSLWLCGHIHEGRGAMRYTFADKNPRPGKPPIDETYVVNAATANEGKARRLVNGPVLIDLVDAADREEHPEWELSPTSDFSEPRRLVRHDSLEALVMTDEPEVEKKENCLLAVDLGLRTGTAVYDSTGTVLAVDSWRFNDHEALDQGLQKLLSSHNITHVVIEGEDRKLFSIWRRAVERMEGVQLARVVADDWRRMLLVRKEMRDARKAKNAAGMIAKQLLKGNEELSGKKLSHDAAEALLVGCYAVRVLGWTNSTEPPVQRYTNGDVAR